MATRQSTRPRKIVLWLYLGWGLVVGLAMAIHPDAIIWVRVVAIPLALGVSYVIFKGHEAIVAWVVRRFVSAKEKGGAGAPP